MTSRQNEIARTSIEPIEMTTNAAAVLFSRPPRPKSAAILGRLPWVLVTFLFVLFLSSGVVQAANTYLVTTTADSGPGSLRQAIKDANTNLGADVINFKIPGQGVHTISPLSTLDAITDEVTIDGYSQLGSSPNTQSVSSNAVLQIQLNGSKIPGGSGDGLLIFAPNCLIRGLIINEFNRGIFIWKVNGLADGKSANISGCILGTNAAGAAALGNNVGVVVSGPDNVIGGAFTSSRNLISGNGQGVLIASKGNLVIGNLIGTNLSGNAKVGNGYGIIIDGGTENTVGGGTTSAINVISGNKYGVFLANGTNNNTVLGNYIGTDATGTTKVGNTTGVVLSGTSNFNLIGVPQTGNVISGNDEDGVSIESSATHNPVFGNLIGTAKNGVTALGNGKSGVVIKGQANFNLVGGEDVDANVIAFNHTGVLLSGTGENNAIYRNSIFSNVGMGIDLAPIEGAVNPNDPGDSDSGPNRQMNYPVIHSATTSGNTTTIQGILNSEKSGNTRIQFFSSPACDASGYGEGKTYLGETPVSLENNETNFSVSFPAVPLGQVVTAVTDFGGNVSEFSQCRVVTAPVPLPDLTVSDATIVEGDSGQTQMTFNVNLSAPAPQIVTVGYVTFKGTASEPGDFDKKIDLLTIPAGGSSGQIFVTINGDLMYEPDETFSILLSKVTGATLSVNQGKITGTIKNNDPLPTITVSDIEIGEGNSGVTPFSFALSLSNPSYQPITVEYATADGTATAGSDYQAAKATFTFQPGQPFQNVPLTVNVNGDTVIEPKETFLLNLSNPGNATIGKAQGVAAISNDDITSISIDDATNSEGNSGSTSFTFTVTLAAQSDVPVTVDYLTVDGTAKGGTDFLSSTGTLTFGAKETSKTVMVTVMGDTDVEPSETFAVKLLNLNGPASFAKDEGAGTIVNDDAAGGSAIEFNQAAYMVTEQLGAITVTVTRTGDASSAAAVDYATADGSAAQKSDFEYAAGTLSFSPGEVSKTFVVLLNQDSYIEGPETFNLVLSNPAGAALGGQAVSQVSITDDLPETVANPVDDAQAFVYMHYHDFLNREPDPTGLAFWTDQITSCGSDAQCIEAKRINVSAAFFLSIEFQETGYLRYLLQKESFGSTPKYAEFVRDVQEVSRGVIVKAPGWEQKLKDNQQQFAEKWVNRPDFKALYDGLSNDDYVTALYKNAGILAPQAEKDKLVAGLNGASMNRATVLLDVAADATFRQQEQNAAFVMMEYFGYLRRDPDAAPDSDLSGYNFWLNKLNQFGGNYIDAEMIKAFINSVEYRQRFAQ